MASREQRRPQHRHGPHGGARVGPPPPPLEGLPEEVLGGRVTARGHRLTAGAVEQLGLLGGVRRDRERLLEELHGLVVRAEGGRPLGGPAERQARLAGERVRLGPLGRVGMGGQVVAGEGAGELVRPESLEEARRRQVAGLAVAAGEGGVGDLADEGLHEGILAALGAARIGVEHEQLAANERPELQPDRRLVELAHRREGRRGEALAQHRRGLEERSIGRLERVEPAADQRGERLRHRQVGQVAGRLVDAVHEGEATLGEQHPDRLDRVQGDAVRATHDGLHRRLRQAGHEAEEQVAHHRLRQRLQAQAHEVPLAGAPVGPPLEQLRPGQGQHVDRHPPGPFHEVVDEVEQARIGEVEVLEDQHDGLGHRQALEERAPRREQLVRARPRLDAQQGEERLLKPTSLLEIRHVLRERRRDALPGGRFVVRLGEAAAAAHHLSQGPERDALAIRGGAALVPPDVIGEAVDVVQELARDPGLADPGRPEDRDEPGPPLARRGVEEVPEQPELLVATHEGGLELVAAIAAAHASDHPQGTPRGHRRRLALERLLAGRLEGDGAARRALRRLADEHRARGRHRLQSGRGVDEVPGDHALVDGAEGHRRLAGQDAGPRLDGGTEGAHRVDQVEGRPDGPLGVVLEGDRGAPDRHDGVADELLDRAPMAAHDVLCQLEVAGEELTGVLGVAPLGERGEADQVGEEDGHDTPLGDRLGRRGCAGRRRPARSRRSRRQIRPDRPARLMRAHRQASPARAAELLARLHRGAAGRAGGREPRAAFDAEAPPRLVLGAAAAADHRATLPANLCARA